MDFGTDKCDRAHRTQQPTTPRTDVNLVLLTCGATVTFGLALGAWAAPPGPLPPAVDQSLARNLFKELVEINTTHEHGSTQAAEVIQRHLLDAGFGAADVVLIAPPGSPTKGNVVVRYRGKGHGKPVLFL